MHNGVMAESPLPYARLVESAPVAEGERVVLLDVLRGVAVLGILLVNITFYAFTFLEAAEWHLEDMSAKDAVARLGIELFATFKFITIFSLLFGMGLGLQSGRAAAENRPFAGMYVRRLVVLLFIGLAHAVLLWYGDILVLYALMGFIALLCRNVRPRRLLITAIVLFLVPLGIMGGAAALWPEEITKPMLDWERIAEDHRASMAADQAAVSQPAEDTPTTTSPTATSPANGPPEDPALAFFAFMADEERVYQSGSWGEMVLHRSVVFFGAMLPVNLLLIGWRCLGLFLLGIFLVRRGLFLGSPQHAGVYRRMALLGLAFGVPLQIAATVSRALAPEEVWGVVVYMFGLYLGSMAMSLAYCGIVALACMRGGLVARLGPVAAVGRMALTNYLSHSVICGFVFYSYGLGLFGRIGHAAAVLVVLAIFGMQLVISPIWLRHFRFGPCEWLWRTLSYWHIQPMRRSG